MIPIQFDDDNCMVTIEEDKERSIISDSETASLRKSGRTIVVCVKPTKLGTDYDGMAVTIAQKSELNLDKYEEMKRDGLFDHAIFLEMARGEFIKMLAGGRNLLAEAIASDAEDVEDEASEIAETIRDEVGGGAIEESDDGDERSILDDGG